MIRRILLPLDSSDYAKAALEYSCHLAKRTDAEVTGLGVVDLPGIEYSVGAPPIGALYYSHEMCEQMEMEVHESISETLKNAAETCRAHGVRFKGAERRGRPEEWLTKEAIYHDLVVAGLRSYMHYGSEKSDGDLLYKVLAGSITPIVGLPATAQPPESGLRVLIAYNGSPLAARALQQFAWRMREAVAEVTVLVSESRLEQANYLLENAAAFLTAHGIKSIRKERTDEDIVDVIKASYIDRADMVVLGAHSKKPLVDFMIGSLAKYMILDAHTPLFIGQ